VRVLLVALNASYVHTNLAVRYLREVLKNSGRDWEIKIREFTINERSEDIAAEIFEEKPDVLGFSCYIWNIRVITDLVRRLRPVLPRTFFLGGGPEVSFDTVELLQKYPEWDGVIVGEGEGPLPELIRKLAGKEPLWEVKGLVWRLREKIALPAFSGEIHIDPAGIIAVNAPAEPVDLNALPNPYSEDESFKGRLVYVETSRGCPYQCAFCLSSVSGRIRYSDPEKFRPVLRRLLAAGASTVKFVDRTFNASKKHAFAVLDVFREEALASRQGGERADQENKLQLRAHCEISGGLLDEEWIAYLQNYPKGMIQLEIGVQSTHAPTLDAIKRQQKFSDWQGFVHYLQHRCQIPVHLDLIAGLPLEGWPEIRRSFNEAFALRPNHLQLGFLKVLKGSELRRKAAEYGIEHLGFPPYTVLQTRELGHAQLLDLHRMAELLDKYYNSGRFKHTLEIVFLCKPNPFDFFAAMARYWQSNGMFAREWSSKALYFNLWKFLSSLPDCTEEEEKIYHEALRFDYLLAERCGTLPDFLKAELPEEDAIRQEKIKREIRSDPCWRDRIPEAANMDRRQWARATAVEYFSQDIPGILKKEPVVGGCWYLFYYQPQETQYYRYAIIVPEDPENKSYL